MPWWCWNARMLNDQIISCVVLPRLGGPGNCEPLRPTPQAPHVVECDWCLFLITRRTICDITLFIVNDKNVLSKREYPKLSIFVKYNTFNDIGFSFLQTLFPISQSNSLHCLLVSNLKKQCIEWTICTTLICYRLPKGNRFIEHIYCIGIYSFAQCVFGF